MPVPLLSQMYAGRVACCILVSHIMPTGQTDRLIDRRTPDRYITLSALDVTTVL